MKSIILLAALAFTLAAPGQTKTTDTFRLPSLLYHDTLFINPGSAIKFIRIGEKTYQVVTPSPLLEEVHPPPRWPTPFAKRPTIGDAMSYPTSVQAFILRTHFNYIRQASGGWSIF